MATTDDDPAYVIFPRAPPAPEGVLVDTGTSRPTSNGVLTGCA
ncbi:hypothetical protein QA942_38460 [Streptomyces sp. B21-106]